MEDIIYEQLAKPVVKKHPFNIQLLHDVLKEDLPPVKKLIGSLIFPEEQTLLFGGGGVGKSSLAMQMANAISKGENLDLGNGIVLNNECDPIRVIYYDFELSKAQIQNRIKGMGYNYNDNLYWANLTRGEIIETEPKKVFEQLKDGAISENAKCIFIDNITSISEDLEKGENAKKFMGEMWRLAREQGYTIIIISHTTKSLKDISELSINHLKGSSTIPQLADNVIGVNNCAGKNEAYIIQFKVRNSEKIYHRDNVIHTRLRVVNDVLIHEAIGYANETELLNNFSVNTDRASNREFYTIASIYYGSNRSAERYLKEVGIDAPHNTIGYNAKAFKDIDSKAYNRIVKASKDEQKRMLEAQSPNQNECLPLVKGHEPEDDQIPF